MKRLNQRGSILLVFIITLPFLITIAIYYMRLSLTSAQVSRFDQFHTMAQFAADAGADYSVEQMALDGTWPGTTIPMTVHSDSQVKTTFTSTVTGTNSSKTVAVTGNTYFPASSPTVSRSVKIYVDLYPVVSGNYSIVAGAGGLYMSNNSKVVGGSVFVNGEINMSNSASIGLAALPVNVQAADQICPIPANNTYPQVCSGTAHPPITMSGVAHIYGTVTATNQTNGAQMSNSGLVAGSVVPPQPLPTYDRASQKTAATNNMTGAAASCSGNGTTVTWPANTKINGDVTTSNSCTIIVKGNVWITGNVTTSNTSQIIIDNSVGATRPTIMIDGSTGLTMNQSTAITSNNSGTGAEIITYYCGASCDEDSMVSGTTLASSRSLTTISLNNSASAPNTIFYAYWSQTSLGNSGQLGAVIGQTIQMNNTAAITFGAASGIGTTVWVIKGYRRQ